MESGIVGVHRHVLAARDGRQHCDGAGCHAVTDDGEGHAVHALDAISAHAHEVANLVLEHGYLCVVAQRAKGRPADHRALRVPDVRVRAHKLRVGNVRQAADSRGVNVRPLAKGEGVGVRVQPRVAPLGVPHAHGEGGTLAVSLTPVGKRHAVLAAVHPLRDQGRGADGEVVVANVVGAF